MSKVRLLIVTGVVLILCGLVTVFVSSQDNETPLPTTLSGIVLNADGPVANAVVQLHGMPDTARTAANGTFTLSGLTGTLPIIITAWSDGHYVGATTLDASAPDWKDGEAIQITLKPLSQSDNNEYDWFSFEGVEGTASCGLCHREYEEWLKDAHSQGAVNPRFVTMYTGTNVAGDEGQRVEFGIDGFPLPNDPEEPTYGPGYLLDNPGRAGNCATCHTPVASTAPNDRNCSWLGCHTNLTIERASNVIAPAPGMPQYLTGDAAEGVTCDFCHKIGEVHLNPETQLPLPDMPGILSYHLYRPTEGEQVFFGTVMDVPRRVSYLPLLSESEYCAGCHYGVFGGVVGNGEVKDGTLIYNSYGEWLASPYSDSETGQTCQDCHMPVSEADWFVYPEQGGLTRDYVELHNHTMPGAADETLLQNTVTMSSSAQRVNDTLQVQVSITNDKTGHHVPTGTPIRSMILMVEAVDANGEPLALDAGPINPEYSGDYGGLPGKTFAKVLRDDWTGETPTGAYWRPVTIVEDTRLAALATDTTNYTFAAPDEGEITVNVRLVFRRAFYALARQKGWNDPDILMECETLQITAN